MNVLYSIEDKEQTGYHIAQPLFYSKCNGQQCREINSILSNVTGMVAWLREYNIVTIH